MKLKFIIILLLFSSLLHAFSDIPYRWDSVKIDAYGGAYVKLARNKKTLKIKHFKVKFGGRKSNINKKWFIDLEYPLFNTMKVTSGCSGFHKKNGKQTIDCSSHVSFDFIIKFEGDEFPEWHEDPQVIFYFRDGVISDRLIRIKDSEDHWSLHWLDAKGNKSKGEEKMWSY